jgi:flagellin
MTTINTNTSATIAANALKQNDRLMNTAMERLSTGKRINNAGDDAAGLAVTSRMTTHIDGLNQAARNANDAIGMIQTADGALGEITGILQRMREISVQASSATYGTTDIAMINTEFTSLRDEVSNIVDYTSWNGSTLLDGTVNGGGAGQLGADTLGITQAQLRALGDGGAATFELTDSNGRTLTITQGLISAGAATSFLNADLDQLATAIALASDNNTGFAQMTAAEIPTGAANATSIVFTQEASGVGQIVSVSGKTDATSSVSIGTGVTRTTNSGSDTVEFQIGNSADQTLSVDFGTLQMTNATGNDLGAAFTTALAITSNATANTAMGLLDTAIDAVSLRRANLGAAISRLEHTVDNLENNAVNASASRSRILDADYAAETTELARTQIIQQAGTAMLSQANEKAQAVLKLLQ